MTGRSQGGGSYLDPRLIGFRLPESTAPLDEDKYQHLPEEELDKLFAKHLKAKQEIAQKGRFLLYKPLPYQRPWFESTKPYRLIVAGNQTGKTTAGAVIMLSAALGVKPLDFGGSLPPTWGTYRQDGRQYLIVGESFKTVIPKTILPKLKEFLLPEMLARKPKVNPQTRCEEIFYLATGAEIHIQSYEQDASSFEGPVWDGVWCDEPMPQPIFSGVNRGLIAKDGWFLMTGTPIAEPYIEDTLVGPSQDEQDPLFGMVDVFTVGMEANCREHSGGYLPHARIAAAEAAMSPEERGARMRGEFINKNARVFGYLTEAAHCVGDLW